MKRGYFVKEINGDYGVPVVANSSKEAKNIVWNSGEIDCDFIDLRVTWRKNAIVDDLPIGVVEDLIDGLKRKLFDSLEDKCEICGFEGYVKLNNNNKIVCRDCRDKGPS